MIKSVKKAMDILTILSNNPEAPVPLNELAVQTHMNKSTCSHILDTMCDSLYVEKVSRKDGYRLGPWSYMLSRYGSYCHSLTQTAAPVLKWLQEQTDAAVFLSVICNGRKYIISHVDPYELLPMSDGTMIQGHIETTATGRLLMAYMDSETLSTTLSRCSEEGASDVMTPAFNAELRTIRSEGHSYCYVSSSSCHSFAYRIVENNRTIAALGILYSDLKDNPEYREKVLRSGRTAAHEISHRLAFQ